MILLRNIFVLIGSVLVCGFAIAILWVMYGTTGLVLSIALSVLAIVGLVSDMNSEKKTHRLYNDEIARHKSYLNEVSLEDDEEAKAVLKNIKFLKSFIRW